MIEDVFLGAERSLPILGLRAALGLTLSAALTPLRPKLREAAPATPAAPAATPEKVKQGITWDATTFNAPPQPS